MQEWLRRRLARWVPGKSHLPSALLAMFLAVCALPADAQQKRVEYIHTDAFGSVAYVTDEQGNVIERSEYEPYGHVLNQPPRNGPGFTGHVADAATGLVNMQQRYYSPLEGRFLSVDPVTAHGGNLQHFNRYAYGYNNPYKFVDPDGRDGVMFYTNPRYQLQQPDPAAAPFVLGLIADFTPLVSDAKGVYEAYQEPTWSNIAAAGVGIVPVVGDAAGKLIKAGGKKIRNQHLAGGVHPKTGIPFDSAGFPDFSGVAIATVQIMQTGSRTKDFRAANRAAGFKAKPEGFTWHHHQDGMTMQLVPNKVHADTGHTGGFEAKRRDDD